MTQRADGGGEIASGSDEYVPVLIAGSGPVGLTLSILLSRQGIRNIVVEKRDRVSTLPRARGITVRTAEILEQICLGEELAAIALPSLWTQYFIYTETLAGSIVGVMPADAMRAESAERYSSARYVVAAQDRIDPMLYRAARSYSHASIRFSTEVVGYTEDDGGITATVRSSEGILSKIRSDYLVAADGGKSALRALAGIGETGRANLRSFVNNHIRADLSQFTTGREAALIWTLAPGLEGVFQMLDGDKMWAVQVQYDPTSSTVDAWTPERTLAHLRAMIGDPAALDVQVEILKSYTYTISMLVAEKFRKGRLILTGDAAHQVPPYGGFGLNTGIQSAHNLAWKLCAVLRGEAGVALLDTYESERREVAARVCGFGRTNSGYVEQLMAAVRSATSVAEKNAIFSRSKQYGTWWGLDLGVHYEGPGAFVDDDAPPPAVADPVIDFIPHAKPGHRAPHFWAIHQCKRISSLSLFDATFVLLAGPEGNAWTEELLRSNPETVPRITAFRVARDGDLVPEGDFCALYGIGASGAVLVRPDGHVAYRAKSLVPNAGAVLGGVLDRIMRRDRSAGAVPDSVP